MIDRIHHVAILVHSADEALKFYRDVMGLTVTADSVMTEQGIRGVLISMGENEIEILEPVVPDTGVSRYLASKGETLHHICFRTDDIDAELARLKSLDVQLVDETPRTGLAGRIAFIHPKAMHGVLVELAQPPEGAHESNAKGFDHIVATVVDFPTARETWKRVLGLEVAHEIAIPARQMVIAQLPSGQCTIELLYATAPESPIAQRIAENGEGLQPSVAFEVQDIDAEIARYRAAGYTLPDAATGPLPVSVTSKISADQAFGLGIQLIQFGRAS